MNYSLWQKRGVWYAGTYSDNKRYSISLRTKDKSIAIRRAEKWISSITDDSTFRLTDLLDFYLDFNPDRSDRTNEMAVEYMSEFIDYLGCNLQSSQISKDTILQYRKHLRSKNKYNTIKIKLGALKAIFNLAYRENFINQMPFKGIVIGKSKPKNLYLSKDEISKLISVCAHDPLYQGYILFMLYTGCRSGELKNLKWADIKAYHLEFNGKTGRREFPLNQDVLRILNQIKTHSKNDTYVCGDHYGRWLGRYSQLGKIVKKFIRKAGLSEEYTAHTLRHTFCSHLVMSGIPIYTVTKLAGHRSVRTTEIYAHLNPEDFVATHHKLLFPYCHN